MKISRHLAVKEFNREMQNYQNEFRQWCSNDSRFYSYEFRELIYFGLGCGLPTSVVHRLIKTELKRVNADMVYEYKRSLSRRASEELQAKIANYVTAPILTFSPDSEFLKYLDTVDYKTVDMSTIKTRGYCFGLSVPEIEALIEEHRTRM